MWLLRMKEGSRLLISMLANLIVVALRSPESERRMHSTLRLTLLCVKFAPRMILILSDVVLKALCLEVNDRLIKHPELLNSSSDREGYIAIIMPKPADWLKVKASLLGLEEYKKTERRELSYQGCLRKSYGFGELQELPSFMWNSSGPSVPLTNCNTPPHTVSC
ncbi:hypothetical protein OIU84_013841 [Salix udensis]|uniref:Uncharacterized protein n=1 Tax=Salix udensis TaxID=889485 RepID=A0AAD6JIT3_9ROSI|nr:hypothetical protein OIU84_013841 [Salix udensis]